MVAPLPLLSNITVGAWRRKFQLVGREDREPDAPSPGFRMLDRVMATFATEPNCNVDDGTNIANAWSALGGCADEVVVSRSSERDDAHAIMQRENRCGHGSCAITGRVSGW